MHEHSPCSAVILHLAFLSLYPIWLSLPNFWISYYFCVAQFLKSCFFICGLSLHACSQCLLCRNRTLCTVHCPLCWTAWYFWRVKASFFSWALCADGLMPQHRTKVKYLLSLFVLSNLVYNYIYLFLYFLIESTFLVKCMRNSCSVLAFFMQGVENLFLTLLLSTVPQVVL